MIGKNISHCKIIEEINCINIEVVYMTGSAGFKRIFKYLGVLNSVRSEMFIVKI